MANLSGGQIIADYLIREKVPYFVGIPGHGVLALLDAFRQRQKEIKVLGVRHEQSAVHLADGYYRVTGKPLACFSSVGPGAINTLVGIGTSFMDSIPVVLFTANCPTYMNERGAMQEIERNHWADFPDMIRPVVKRTWNVTSVEQLCRVLPTAFRLATSGRPGPVHIDLPMDVQAQMMDVQVPEPAGHKAAEQVSPDSADTQKAAELLLSAKRPLILAGGGAIYSGSTPELIELAEVVGAPVVTSFGGKSAVPEDHPLASYFCGFMGSSCGNQLTQTADVILAIGCRFSEWTCSSYKPGITFNIPPTKVIQVDIDPREIAKNYPVEVGLVGHAKPTLRQLIDLARKAGRGDYRDSEYFREIRRLKTEWENTIAGWQKCEPGTITTAAFLKELRGFLDRDAIVTGDAGHNQAQLYQAFPIYGPGTFVSSGAFSTMGYAVPSAIGAQLGAPGRQVAAVVGDGGFLMTCQELATAVQYDIPIVVCISNNFAWCSIRDMQRAWYGEDGMFLTEFVDNSGKLVSPDFKLLGESFGCHGERVTSVEQMRPALERAYGSGKPAVIEILTDRTYPRSELPVTGWADYPTPDYLREKS
ncbi:MAG: hypothetical protein A2Z18_10155 [Armatimonadetes bacterium RBG_16_58_9]|nr:MAG: hypothetical protein A2Z18_10155 [Armatimonadetes bacterium RBG_16_58_9]